MKTKAVLVLTFLGVFLFGAVAGGAVVARWGRQILEHRSADRASFQQWKRLADELQLSDAQREQIRPILRRAVQDRLDNQRQQQRISARVDKELEDVLTPAQMDKYREIRSRGHDREKRWQRVLREMRTREETPSSPPSSGAPTPPP